MDFEAGKKSRKFGGFEFPRTHYQFPGYHGSFNLFLITKESCYISWYSSYHKVHDDGQIHMDWLFPAFLLQDIGKLHFHLP